MSGYGFLTNKDTKHIGYFSHDNMHGYGASFYHDQFAILGNWENDYIEGFAFIIELPDLEQSNNIINTNNEYNCDNDELENNYQIVKTCKGEIVQKNIENDELNEFKNSKEYSEMIQLYKNKIYPDFLQYIEKNSCEENESNIENDNE